MWLGLETLNIKIGLVKAIEQHEGIGTSAVEPLAYVDHGAEEWRQLDGDWNLQTSFYLLHEFAIAVFDGVAAFVRVGFNRVEVELNGVSASSLHLTGVANPASGRCAVQTGNNGS